MATVEELQTAITDVLQDDVFSSDRILALINQGIRYCALQVLLPKLEASCILTTIPGSYEVNITGLCDYYRNFYHCHDDEGNEEIKVLDSLGALLREYPNFGTSDTTGPVERVFLRVDYLYYYPSPTTATQLHCYFYKNPCVMVNDSDSPDCIPSGMQEELLVNFVLWKCFSELEDGFEGPRNNTQYYRDLFNIALAGLDTLIDYGQSRPRPAVVNGWV